VDIAEYVTTLRRRWRVIVAAVLAGLLVGAAFAWLTPRTYTASARTFVTIGADRNGDSTIVQESQFTLDRVKSYTQLVSSPQVLRPVIDDLRLSDSVSALRSRVSADSPLNTVLIDVTASDGNAERSARIADAVARQLGVTIEDLEKPRSGTSPVNVTLIEPASVPSTPASPRPALDLGLGLLVGLAAGLALAVLRERLDSTVKSRDDLRRLVDVPQLGSVPIERALRTRHVLAADHSSPWAEHFRTIRTNLQFVDVDHPVRQVVVTSAVPDEGKTTAACNLAVSLAQSGLQVCLVEADLRRPRAAGYFGVEGAVGLTDVVTGACSLDDALISWDEQESVRILAAGRRPPDANSVLGSTAVADLMVMLGQRFDVVVYDAPPLAEVTDAALLARRTDGAVLVVRHGHVRQAQILEATRALQLADARLLGTVLTFSRERTRGGYGYGGASAHRQQSGRAARRETARRETGRPHLESDDTASDDALAIFSSARTGRSDDIAG
jgi:capsular exopolysaccharide synthesis family protein